MYKKEVTIKYQISICHINLIKKSAKVWFPLFITATWPETRFVVCKLQKLTFQLSLLIIFIFSPGKTIHNCRPSKLADRRIFWSWEALIDGFQASKIVNGSVGPFLNEKLSLASQPNNRQWQKEWLARKKCINKKKKARRGKNKERCWEWVSRLKESIM